MLLGYLCRCLESDDSTQLSREQVARWCSVLLDAHYIQLILSHQARLLLELHENTLQQVRLVLFCRVNTIATTVQLLLAKQRQRWGGYTKLYCPVTTYKMIVFA